MQSSFRPARLLAALLLAGTAGLSAQAQTAAPATAKTVVAEPAQVFPAFDRWVTSVWTAPVEAPPAPSFTRVITVVMNSTPAAPSAPAPAAASTANYEPHPVILGVPELPLLGDAGATAARWGSSFNYQGVSLRQVVIDRDGRNLESRPMGRQLRPGERFKLRITPSFDAVADIDQVRGDIWYGQRIGQAYPQQGFSVEVRAGQTVDLPLDPNEYFVMDRWDPTERLVLSVRHARAVGGARSNQPNYRQDSRNASQYLQLVPAGQYPAFEQLVLQAH